MDDLFIFVELKQKSFEKYIRARADVEKPGWFKLFNRVLEDDEFYNFTASEICAWIYIMSQASIQQNAKIRLILDKVDAFRRKFSRDDIRNAITKLKNLGILVPGATSDVTPTLRPRNAAVSLGEERIGEDWIGDKNKAGGEGGGILKIEPPPADAAQNKPMGIILPDLAGNSAREQVLAKIPIDIQQEWLDRYDLIWLKQSLLHAIQNYAKDEPLDLIKDWPTKLTRWFKIEKKAKFKPEKKIDWAEVAKTVQWALSEFDCEEQLRFRLGPELFPIVERIGIEALAKMHRDDFYSNGMVPGLLKQASLAKGKSA